MNKQLVDELAKQSGLDTYPGWVHEGRGYDNLELYTKLVIKQCLDCCKEIADEADAMKNSKYLTDAGKMLHEGMWGGASNSSIAIKNKFGIQ